MLPDGWVIDGELYHLNTALLRGWCERMGIADASRRLELAGLEILDSEVITAMIEAIRHLLHRISVLTVVHAPHLLSHTSTGLACLRKVVWGGGLSLVEPRQEEPYG